MVVNVIVRRRGSSGPSSLHLLQPRWKMSVFLGGAATRISLLLQGGCLELYRAERVLGDGLSASVTAVRQI